MNKENLLIIGAGGHGRVAADVAMAMNIWNSVMFLDDRDDIDNPLGLKVLGKSDDVSKFINSYDIFTAIGDNKTRERILRQLLSAGASVPVLIHPNAVIGTNVEIGLGTVVMAGAVINCCSKVGMGCIINTGATVDHDNIIEDYVHISPGAHLAGVVKVGRGTWVGIGGTVINNISIAEESVIGAGAVVTGNIDETGTYVGVPAKRLY